MSLLNVDSGADNSLSLHLCDFRIGYCKTKSAVTHHRVKLVKRSDDSLNLLNGLALSVCKLLDVSFFGGNELVKRRIEETDCYRAALKCFIELFKVALLIRKNLIKSSFSLFNGVGANHLSECGNSVLFKEHMLCTAKADALSAELSCLLSVSRSICIGTNLEGSVLIGPAHYSAEGACYGSVNSRDNALIDVTGRTVY